MPYYNKLYKKPKTKEEETIPLSFPQFKKSKIQETNQLGIRSIKRMSIQ